MSWILAAFLMPLFHGLANIVDNYLCNKLFKRIDVLVFYASLMNILFVPIVWFLDAPHFLPFELWPYVAIIAVIDIFYMFPYYKALQSEDTSIVTSLFDIGKILIPILAFFMVGEKLQPVQYAGFLLIILSSAALTFKPKSRFHFNASFFYMLLCSLMLSVEAVLYKYVFTSVSWGTGFIWADIASSLVALSFLLLPHLRRRIRKEFPAFRKNLKAFLSVEALTFGGTAAATYAVSLAPVTVQEGIGSIQSFVVLGYALVLKRFFPKIFREGIDRRTVMKKMFLFVLIAAGVILIVR